MGLISMLNLQEVPQDKREIVTALFCGYDCLVRACLHSENIDDSIKDLAIYMKEYCEDQKRR